MTSAGGTTTLAEALTLGAAFCSAEFEASTGRLGSQAISVDGTINAAVAEVIAVVLMLFVTAFQPRLSKQSVQGRGGSFGIRGRFSSSSSSLCFEERKRLL